jgi:5'-nucleotidase
MTIAITNDDGYTEGAMILLRVAKKYGDAYAILPDRQRSAIGTAITLHKPLRLHEREKDVYTLSGTPADCSLFAMNSHVFKKPDAIFSGINWGDNSAITAVISSGTIGACWKAAVYGVPSIAFSLYRSKGADRHGWMKKEKWHSEILEKKVDEIYNLLKDKLVGSKFFVVNLPGFDHLETAKISFPKKIQERRFTAVVEERQDPYGHPYYWIVGQDKGIEKGTDLHEIAVNGNITIKEISIKDIS